jgi:tetratricopeptide (TPR) repeat protein
MILIFTLIAGFIGLLAWYYLFVITNITKQSTRKNRPPQTLDATAVPNPECITCDSCQQPGPTLRCTTCQLVYYCNPKCQENDRIRHQQNNDCKSATAIAKELLLSAQEVEVEAESSLPCGICLESSSSSSCSSNNRHTTHPMMIRPSKACSHIFCFACLTNYQRHARNSMGRDDDDDERSHCPLCRTQFAETNVDLRQVTLSRAVLYATQASTLAFKEHERYQDDKNRGSYDPATTPTFFARLALEEADKLTQLDDDHEAVAHDRMQVNYIRCIIAKDVNTKYQEALECSQDTVRLLHESLNRNRNVQELMAEGRRLGLKNNSTTNDGDDDSDDDVGEEEDDGTYERMQAIQNEIMTLVQAGLLSDPSEYILTVLEEADIYQCVQRWDTAIQRYKDILAEFPEQTTSQSQTRQRIFLGLARCLYEQGEYGAAIELGEATIAMNRHYPADAHRTVALACRANGDMDRARTVMGQAVLYETPWDQGNVERQRKLWIELMGSKT